VQGRRFNEPVNYPDLSGKSALTPKGRCRVKLLASAMSRSLLYKSGRQKINILQVPETAKENVENC